MSEIGVASRITQGDLDSDLLVAGGEPVIVHAIILSNADASNPREVEFRQSDGTTLLFKMTVGTSDTIVFEAEFIADNGLHVENVGDSDCSVSIFHSHPGR